MPTTQHQWRNSEVWRRTDPSTGNVLFGPLKTLHDLFARNLPDNRVGAQNPGWRSLVKSHRDATTPYYADRGRVLSKPGRLESRHVAAGGTWDLRDMEGDFLYIEDVLPSAGSPDGTLESRVNISWVKKANKELRTMQSGVSLGELRETIHAIRHPLESLKKGLHDYLAAVPRDASRRSRRKSKGQRAKAISQAISGTYLEYANGWAPLTKDIDAAARTLAEHFVAPGLSYRKVRSQQQLEPSNSSTLYSGALILGIFDALRTQSLERSARIIGEVAVSHNGSSTDLLRSSGFNLREFVPTMWELIPLSYVADYFGNIGDILEYWAFCSSSRTWWSLTSRNRLTLKIEGVGMRTLNQLADEYYRGNLGTWKFEHTVLQRSDPGDWAPSLAFSLPGSSLLRKLANVSSLGVQALTSSRQLNRLLHG